MTNVRNLALFNNYPSSNLSATLQHLTSLQSDIQKTISVIPWNHNEMYLFFSNFYSPLIQNTYHSILVGGRVKKSILLMTFDENSYFECKGMNFACHLFKTTSEDREDFHTLDIVKV